jgi:NAD(P)-dependent dehydrogenase (short-subunit alcohol dehydrogenase family)
MIDCWGENNPPKDPQISFSGKTVLVTGSNAGLGYQAALKFLALGALKLNLAVFISARGETAKKKIVQATACNPTTTIAM